MKTNRLKITTAESAIEEVKSKREWVKPEVEVISKDIIEGGIITTLHEGETTFGFRGQMS